MQQRATCGSGPPTPGCSKPETTIDRSRPRGGVNPGPPGCPNWRRGADRRLLRSWADTSPRRRHERDREPAGRLVARTVTGRWPVWSIGSERWSASSGDDVTVVFERRPRPPIASPVIEIAHAPAPGPNAADDEIVRRVRADPDPRSIRVVTSDHVLIDLVHGPAQRSNLRRDSAIESTPLSECQRG